MSTFLEFHRCDRRGASRHFSVISQEKHFRKRKNNKAMQQQDDTLKQQQCIQEMRKRLLSINDVDSADKGDVTHLTQEELDMCDDYCITRYLIARNYDIEASFLMLTNSIRWRREFGTGALRAKDVKETNKNGRSLLLSGRDYSDRPLVWVKMSKVSGDAIENLKLMVWQAEMCKRLSKSQALSMIIDLKDCSVRNFDIHFMRLIVSTMSSHYPELLGFAIIIHTPLIFNMIYKMVSPMIDEKTRTKVIVAGSSNICDQMKKLMPLESIPVEYGGTASLDFNWEEYFEKWNTFENENQSV